jgi:hypothetical protein
MPQTFRRRPSEKCANVGTSTMRPPQTASHGLQSAPSPGSPSLARAALPSHGPAARWSRLSPTPRACCGDCHCGAHTFLTALVSTASDKSDYLGRARRVVQRHRPHALGHNVLLRAGWLRCRRARQFMRTAAAGLRKILLPTSRASSEHCPRDHTEALYLNVIVLRN